ncbi:LapA family protein [Pseudokordiimonas caeni]|uniref:LapA family protein n=1 Tax=Pseudokordiimonas caeni TaxID=2997908 RepID=UPI002812764E|nr:LapA family protein [Pseudokordiimonas caeni]
MTAFIALLRRLFWGILAVLLVFFAVNNRAPVTIAFEPFPFTVTMPLWLVLFVGIFVGLAVAGMVTSWLRLKGFTARRKAERRAKSLEGEMADLTARAQDAERSATENAIVAGQTGPVRR